VSAEWNVKCLIVCGIKLEIQILCINTSKLSVG
jgi:hypothetical protein